MLSLLVMWRICLHSRRDFLIFSVNHMYRISPPVLIEFSGSEQGRPGSGGIMARHMKRCVLFTERSIYFPSGRRVVVEHIHARVRVFILPCPGLPCWTREGTQNVLELLLSLECDEATQKAHSQSVFTDSLVEKEVYLTVQYRSWDVTIITWCLENNSELGMLIWKQSSKRLKKQRSFINVAVCQHKRFDICDTRVTYQQRAEWVL